MAPAASESPTAAEREEIQYTGTGISTIAADLVGWPGLFPQDRRDFYQHLVTGRMAVSIVYGLEVIDIYHDTGNMGRWALLPAGQFSFAAFNKGAAVGQPGQPVDGGHFPVDVFPDAPALESNDGDIKHNYQGNRHENL